MSKYVVFGATGYAGGHLVDELAGRGHEVVAVSRTPIEARDGLYPVAGSIDDSALLRALAKSSAGVVLAVPPILAGARLSELLPEILTTLEASASRLVVVGGAGSLVRRDGTRVVDADDFPERARAGSLEHVEALSALRATKSPVDWLSVSPAERFGRFAPGERRGTYRVSEGDALLVDEDGTSAISASDFALAISDELESPRYHRTRITFAY
jgi:uncharacterized protein